MPPVPEPEPQPETVLDKEKVKIMNWRLDNLRQSGIAMEPAMKLAAVTAVDIYKAAEMKKNGCSDELLVKILL